MTEIESRTPLKDARAAGVKCIGDDSTGKYESRIPTEAEVDQEERDLKTPEEEFNEKVEMFRSEVQEHLDSLAKSWGYDSIISLCSYYADPNQTYSVEATIAIKWRGDVWEYCYTELQKIHDGERPEPESAEAFILELPIITRPT